MSALNTYGQSIQKWPKRDPLFIKFQGRVGSLISEPVKPEKEITKGHRATGFEATKDQKEPDALWADRKNSDAARALMAGCKSWPTDVW